MRVMFGILTYKATYSSLNMYKWFGLRICSKQWDLGYDELYLISVFLNFSHVPRPTIDTGLMFTFNHLLTPTLSWRKSWCAQMVVSCTHLYLVLFLLGIHCQLMHLRRCKTSVYHSQWIWPGCEWYREDLHAHISAWVHPVNFWVCYHDMEWM